MQKSAPTTWLSRSAVLSITALASIVFDQGTKLTAQYYLQAHASVSYFNGVFNFVYAENTGAMLSIGSGLPENTRFLLFVIGIGFALVAASLFVLLRPLRTMTVLAISMVVGGGIGNLIDRLIHHGSVIDFMVIKIGSIESGIFNVADLAITLGICLLCTSFITSKDTST